MSANTLATPTLGCDRCRTPPSSKTEQILEHVRGLYYDCHECYALYRCRDCAQTFLEQFHEIVDWVGAEDDLWQRWTPITDDELAEVDRLFPEETDDYADVPRLTALMHRRGRLTKDPEGAYYWSEDGWDPGDLLPPG
jgi:hypothetical protein